MSEPFFITIGIAETIPPAKWLPGIVVTSPRGPRQLQLHLRVPDAELFAKIAALPAGTRITVELETDESRAEYCQSIVSVR